MEPPAKRRCMLPGYFLSLTDQDGRNRYMDKLMAIGGCPYCHKRDQIIQAVEDATFCLEENSGQFQLKRAHAYYYQVQCQLFCTHKSYCDFIVWMENDINIERIYPDVKFWEVNVAKAKALFNKAILPELIGKFYSRPSNTAPKEKQSGSSLDGPEYTDEGSAIINQTQEATYCYCNGPEEGDMVGCDNPSCNYQWFHLTCLDMDSAPTTKFWYCPDCQKLPKFQKKQKIKKKL